MFAAYPLAATRLDIASTAQQTATILHVAISLFGSGKIVFERNRPHKEREKFPILTAKFGRNMHYVP
ncbi:MAG: hypothetical protein ACYDDO_03910 [Acidiferrobacterales bacterium]